MRTISFSNQKGGVAKTTTALNVSVGLANAGKRVLAIDLDPQSNLSFSLDAVPDVSEVSLMDVLAGDEPLTDALTSIRVGLDLASIGLEGTVADMKFTQMGREYLLRDALATVADHYDYCVVDTAPTLNVLTMNALTAADAVIIPVNLDSYGLQGVSQLNGFIRNIKKFTNQDLKIEGVVITAFDPRAQTSKALEPVVQNAIQVLGCPILAKIRKSADIGKAQLARKPIYEYAPNSKVACEYQQLVEVILNEGEH